MIEPIHKHQVDYMDIIEGQNDVIQSFKKELKAQLKEIKELRKKLGIVEDYL